MLTGLLDRNAIRTSCERRKQTQHQACQPRNRARRFVFRGRHTANSSRGRIVKSVVRGNLWATSPGMALQKQNPHVRSLHVRAQDERNRAPMNLGLGAGNRRRNSNHLRAVPRSHAGRLRIGRRKGLDRAGRPTRRAVVYEGLRTQCVLWRRGSNQSKGPHHRDRCYGRRRARKCADRYELDLPAVRRLLNAKRLELPSGASAGQGEQSSD